MQHLEIVKNIAVGIGYDQQNAGVAISPEDFVKQSVNPALMIVAYEWARGVPFETICGITDVLEGSIVRCILRIAETCRDVQNAARVTGDLGMLFSSLRFIFFV